MAQLSKKKASFARIYVATGNASQAYRMSHRSKAKPESVWVAASRLLNDPAVAERIDGIRRELNYRHLQTLDAYLLQLDRVISDARSANRYHSAIAGMQLKAKILGWDRPPEQPQAPTEPDIDVADLTDSEIDALERILARRDTRPAKH